MAQLNGDNHMKAKFTVSRDAEAKANKEVETVEIEIDFDGVPDSLIQKHAIANQVVGWQAQIRNNWDKFLEAGTPETMKFGDTIFEGGRKAAVVTDVDVEKYLEKLRESDPERFEELTGQSA